jgi:hypothetical protein
MEMLIQTSKHYLKSVFFGMPKGKEASTAATSSSAAWPRV